MQIYYKCGYGFRQQSANWSCRKAKSKGITIADELVNQMSQWPKLMHKAEDFKTKMRKISASQPHDAIELINRFWYFDYAKEKELDIGKTDILYALAVREQTIGGFLSRLEELPKLIEGYKCTNKNPVILSTIHSAKGLEFDTVYIIDAYDGCLPHTDRETATEQERIDSYEEERRIFYVAITRAKNELYLFSVQEHQCSFVNEIVSPPQPKADMNQARPNVMIQELRSRQDVLAAIKTKTTVCIPYQQEGMDSNPTDKERIVPVIEKKKQRYDEGYEDVRDQFTQQATIIRDRFGNRWVKCEKCGVIKQDVEFVSYGGQEHINLGTCRECSRKQK